MDPISSTSPPGLAAASKQDPLREAATELEAAFLTEMLKSAGLGKSRDSMGGGAGEDQFGSFLVRAQAEQIARTGGIGLAESLFNALKEAENDK
ncbi:rod-binding protein [Sedimentitalea sp. HM32M-2]|uniref:rod-binding protein n=1 Tax=Sedimentitalea sp. HM32M-2 TaxID=3351566 RepID=UPI003645177E